MPEVALAEKWSSWTSLLEEGDQDTHCNEHRDLGKELEKRSILEISFPIHLHTFRHPSILLSFFCMVVPQITLKFYPEGPKEHDKCVVIESILQGSLESECQMWLVSYLRPQGKPTLIKGAEPWLPKIMVSVLQQSLAWDTHPCGHSHRPPGQEVLGTVKWLRPALVLFFSPHLSSRPEHWEGREAAGGNRKLGSHSPFKRYLRGPVIIYNFIPPKPAPLEFFTHDTQNLKGGASKDEEKSWRSHMCACTHLSLFWNSFFFPLIQRLLVKVKVDMGNREK